MRFVTIPANGWAHFEPDGTEVNGNTDTDLIDNVRKYRVANNLPIGDPEADVYRQLHARQPSIFGAAPPPEDNEAPPKIYGKPVKRRAIDQLANWTANRMSRQGSLHYESIEVAQRRGAICAQCPQNNANWKSDLTRDCPSCADRIPQLESTLLKIRKGNQTALDRKLGMCRTFCHENSTAIWLSEKNLRHRQYYEKDAPENCWLKQLKMPAAPSAD